MHDDQRDELLAQALYLREQGHTEEAREDLLTLAQRYPDDAGVAYQAAWIHDAMGLEAEAVGFYERSLGSEGLSQQDRRGAYVGLGSTYRVLGRYDEAVATLRRGLLEFPEDAAMLTFLAMALYNTGETRESVSTLLKILAATSEDEHVRSYRRAIEYYAEDLDAMS